MTFCYPNIEVDPLALGAAAVAEGARNTVSQQQKRSEVSPLQCALLALLLKLGLTGLYRRARERVLQDATLTTR